MYQSRLIPFLGRMHHEIRYIVEMVSHLRVALHLVVHRKHQTMVHLHQ